MDETAPLLARFGDFVLDEANARLCRGERPVELPPKAFAVLCTLLRQPGRLVAKDALLDAVWGHRHVSESVLKSTISQLRAALDDDARQPRCIETASRRGYRFIAGLGPVAAAPSEAHPAAVESPSPAAPAAAGHAVAAPPWPDATLAPATSVPAPVPGWAPVPAPAASGPGPAAPDALPLVDRDGALAALHAAWDAARQGRRQLVLVAGEPGIGKTALIDRFTASLAALPSSPLAPAPVQALGPCVEHYGAGEPYMPVLEALNMLCRRDDGAALVELMRRVAPTWLVQLPWFLGDEDRRRLPREVAGATQDRMLRECGELLDRLTAERPLLLVLEDLHWSDHATVQLIGYLARRRTAAALMLLGSFRPTEVIVEEHPLAGLRQELRLHRLCRELDLESLSEAGVGALVAARLGGAEAPEDFVRALHAHTEGLPLFAVALLDELQADGALRRAGDGWVFPDATGFRLPRGIAGVVEKQIARLPEPLRQLLNAASVAGAEFEHLMLAELLPMPADAAQALLDEAAARGHWLRCLGAEAAGERIATRYAFRHVLFQHVFYERLGPAQRMGWHRRVAEALRRTPAGRAPDAGAGAELALHLERGGLAAEAVAQWATVGRRALGRSAARAALRAARHALALHAQAPDAWGGAGVELELRVLEGVSLSRLHVISTPEVAAAFERARALCDAAEPGPALARALHGLWWVAFARGELPQAAAIARRISSLATAGGNAVLRLAGCSANGLTLSMMGELREAQRQLEAAIETYRQVGDDLPPGMFVQDPGVEAHGYLALVCWWRGRPGAARRHAREAVALAERIRHPISELIAHHLAAVLHYFAGEPALAMAQTDAIHPLMRRHGLPEDPGAFGWLHGHLRAAAGEVDEGFAEMFAAERSCRRLGMCIAMTGFHMHLAEACCEAGRIDDGLAAVDAGLAIAQAQQERFLLSPLHRVRAELQAARGERAAALTSYAEAARIAHEQDAGFHELAAGVGWLECAAAEDAPPDAAAWRERVGALLAAQRDDDAPPGPLVTRASRQLERQGARR